MKLLRYSAICYNLCILAEFVQYSVCSMAACALGSHKPTDFLDAFFQKFAVNYKVPEKDVRFYLCNNEHPHPFEISLNDEKRLIAGEFDVKKPTKIIIHGYNGGLESKFNVLLTEAFVKNGDFNILLIDWRKVQHWGLIMLPYPQVVKKLNSVADHVTNFMYFLKRFGMKFEDVTIIGHSLGAHVAGIAGYNFQGQIDRMIGLDPAGPYFHHKPYEERLSKQSAHVVEVIHSDIEECGLSYQLGHYDFYPNGGKHQPGCSTYKCSHARSFKFFAESLDANNKFIATWCSGWSEMQSKECHGDLALMGGLTRAPIKEGMYYLETASAPPFALGDLL